MVPPVKSTPRLRPLNVRKAIESMKIEVDITAEILRYFIKGISFLTLKISIV